MDPENDLEGTTSTTPEAPPSLRDTISTAMDAAEADAEGEGSVSSETEGARQEEQQGLQRDENGKFKGKKEEAKTDEGKPEEPKTEEGKPEEGKPEAPRVAKAPQSWRTALREKFSKLDPDVQQEILKREREISNGFNEVSEVKKFKDHFLGTVNQFSNVINAEGGRPLETIHNLLKTANVLYVGTPVQKAQTVAAIIKNFGIDVETLDQMLSGQDVTAQARQPAGQDLATLVQQQVQQALGPLLAMQQQNVQKTEADAAAELDAFMNDPTNEFAHDVKDTMADIMEAAAKRGQKMDLQTAYSRAILAHNDIADIVARRKQGQQTEQVVKKAQTARRRAVSISGAPVIQAPATNNLRDAIAHAFDQHES